MYTYHVFLNYSSVDEYLGHFHFLAFVNSAAIDMGVQVSLGHTDFISFACILSGIAESYGSYIINFLRNFYMVYHNDCINLHSYPQCANVPLSVHPHQHLSFVFL